MPTTSYTFFVTTADYPKLQAACPGDFPFPYEDFVIRVDHGIKQRANTMTIIKVYARVNEFLAWCAKTKVKPNNQSRSQYAVLMGHQLNLH